MTKNFLFALVAPYILLTSSLSQAISTKDFAGKKASGTSPRLEKEFKYSLKGNFTLKENNIKNLSSNIQKTLIESLNLNMGWKAPALLGNNYYADSKVKNVTYFDIYFDTEDHLIYQLSMAYRLRERFKRLDNVEKNFQYPTKKKYWPYRIEFQAKSSRKNFENGLSSAYESRFEFRKDSPPFSNKNPPPKRPWNLKNFIRDCQSGIYKNYYTWPAKSLIDNLNAYTQNQEINVKPLIVIISERYRQHLNVKTPWGTGPNPEQAFIITIDVSNIYEADRYLKHLFQNGNMPEKIDSFKEIEIEFERNVSQELDSQITKAKNSTDQTLFQQLCNYRNAFLYDQKIIAHIIKEYFLSKNITITPQEKSKYQQAYEIIYK